MRLPLSLALAALAAACGPGASPPGVQARDSAGVAVVTSTAAVVGAAPRWRLGDTARLELGPAAGAAAAAWLPDELLAVAGGGGVRLHAGGDPSPRSVAGLGATGWIGAAGDSALAYDAAARSVAVLDREGRVARRFALRGGAPVGAFSDGTLLVRGEGGAPSGPAPYLRVGRTGAPLDTVGRFSRGAPLVAAGPGVWHAAGDRPAVERLSRRGVRVRSVRWEDEPGGVSALVPAAEGDLWVRGRPAAGQDSAGWLVLREDGRVRARLRLPAATRVLAVSGASAVVAEPDPRGGERVRVRDIRRP